MNEISESGKNQNVRVKNKSKMNGMVFTYIILMMFAYGVATGFNKANNLTGLKAFVFEVGCTVIAPACLGSFLGIWSQK